MRSTITTTIGNTLNEVCQQWIAAYNAVTAKRAQLDDNDIAYSSSLDYMQMYERLQDCANAAFEVATCVLGSNINRDAHTAHDYAKRMLAVRMDHQSNNEDMLFEDNSAYVETMLAKNETREINATDIHSIDFMLAHGDAHMLAETMFSVVATRTLEAMLEEADENKTVYEIKRDAVRTLVPINEHAYNAFLFNSIEQHL